MSAPDFYEQLLKTSIPGFLAVDAATNTIVATTLTTSEGDAGQVGPLLDQTTGPINAVMADGPYDGAPTY